MHNNKLPLLRAQKRQAVLLTSSDDQKMQILVQVRKKLEKFNICLRRLLAQQYMV